MKKDMPSTMIPLNVVQFEETKKYSPDYVRISAASAMALRLKSGDFPVILNLGASISC